MRAVVRLPGNRGSKFCPVTVKHKRRESRSSTLAIASHNVSDKLHEHHTGNRLNVRTRGHGDTPACEEIVRRIRLLMQFDLCGAQTK
jgi:hypothetical protein